MRRSKLELALLEGVKKYGKKLTQAIANIFKRKPKSSTPSIKGRLTSKAASMLIVGNLYQIGYTNLKGESGVRFIIPTSCERTGEGSCLYQSKKSKKIIAAAFNVGNVPKDQLKVIAQGLQEIPNLSYQDKELIEALGDYVFHNFFLDKIRDVKLIRIIK